MISCAFKRSILCPNIDQCSFHKIRFKNEITCNVSVNPIVAYSSYIALLSLRVLVVYVTEEAQGCRDRESPRNRLDEGDVESPQQKQVGQVLIYPLSTKDWYSASARLELELCQSRNSG